MRINIDFRFAGLVVFILSLLLYTITLEPTISFWDCSEFILSAAKLEINHPAGAPLFMLLGRLFTFLSFSNPERIAWSINFMSGFFSALTVFFLFHILNMLLKKISSIQVLTVGGAALGALTFAVSDSFWFSAVEGEVYGLSMFFLVLTLWSALKWEQDYGRPGNEKWILFLALITGLGIGVHLLNLLVLPSVAIIAGFKKYGFSAKKMVLYFFAGIALLLAVLYLFTPVVLKILAFLEFRFVNNYNLPKHSGVLAGILVLFLFLTLLFFVFQKKKNEKAVLLTLSFLFFYVGFSIYSVNIIRSSSNPPINFGRPDNIYSLINYLNREQYPKRPLLYGENYNSPVIDAEERTSKEFLNGKYETTELAPTYKFDEATTTLFPRMYNREERHVQAYNSWINIKGKRVRLKDSPGTETLVVPTLGDQLKFFVRYQFGYMYVRYFMWNFVGRQNDRQGRGDLLSGNWISGIKWMDNLRLGDQKSIPDWMKNNRARNTYFFIPLLLGLVGFYFHYKKDKVSFFVVLSLFLMGGLGLTVYINEVPITPRERDYVFVGSFLAFCIWIGFSLLALADQLRKVFRAGKTQIISLLVVLLLACPALMLSQNLDDHNRSGRTVARDLALNILNSCPENAILFTSGDNDTYPLLYCQEVEGIRTDVRIVIMPFLAANWFIDGLRDPKYDDPGLHMVLPQAKYDLGKLDFIPVVDRIKRETSWKDALDFLKSDHVNSKVTMSSGEKLDFLPADSFSFSFRNKENSNLIQVSLKDKKYIYKNELALWDIISSNSADRPICFVSKMEARNNGLGNHLRCEGFVYRVVPEVTKQNDFFSLGNFDADKMYRFLMEDMRWGNIADPEVYVCWNAKTNLNVFQVRNVFNEVAQRLMEKGELQKASDLLLRCAEQLPLEKLPYDIFLIRQVELMLSAGLENVGQQLLLELENDISSTLNFFDTLPENQKIRLQEEIRREMHYLSQLSMVSAKAEIPGKKKELDEKLSEFYHLVEKG